MKVVFLDIDGVLNSIQSHLYHEYRQQENHHALCPIATSNLSWLVRTHDLEIVISSTWRKYHETEWIKEHLETYSIPGEKIRGITPILHGPNKGTYVDRGLEIAKFMEVWHSKGFDHIEKFVIIDDNSDMAHLKDNLVQTNPLHGLTVKDLIKCQDILGVENKLPYVGF